ncbi:L-alanine-DL-glutamate epimerase-like enolase superfamily enzyme [Bradyrhizobium ottawaense]
MEITDVRAHHIRIPYDAGVASFRQGASAITALDMVLVEVTTDAGLTGWGDAFAYVCPRTTRSAVEEMIAPQARGLKVPDAAGIPAAMEQIQRNLHLFGRYGITMFAISGLDIALWDLAAKVEGVPLHRLLGETRRTAIPAYASLLRIGSPDNIAAECRKALALGYGAIKLHETTAPAVFAAREAIGPAIPLMVDMNCPLTAEQAIAFATSCRDARPMFLEEPVWPPEDFAALAEVRSKGGLGIAAGRECLHGISIPPDDGGGRGEPRPAVGDQGRRHHGISEGRGARRSARRQDRSALPVFRSGPARDAASPRDTRRRAGRDVLSQARGLPLGRPRGQRCHRPCRGALGRGARL